MPDAFQGVLLETLSKGCQSTWNLGAQAAQFQNHEFASLQYFGSPRTVLPCLVPLCNHGRAAYDNPLA